jgi:3-oxoacyl-ACP reductase-like protein
MVEGSRIELCLDLVLQEGYKPVSRACSGSAPPAAAAAGSAPAAPAPAAAAGSSPAAAVMRIEKRICGEFQMFAYWYKI